MRHTCTKCLCEKDEVEFYFSRRQRNSWCKICVRAIRRAYVEANREKANAAVRAWRKKYRDRARASDKATKAKKPDFYRERRRQNYKRNLEKYSAMRKKTKRKHAAKIKIYNKRYVEEHRARYTELAAAWRQNNPGAFRAIKARRRAAELNATPWWADLDAIRAVYDRAELLSEITGVAHEVDHIVPLTSQIVCGLHVPDNLQCIPAKENQSKNNRRWPFMPETPASETVRQWKSVMAAPQFLPPRALGLEQSSTMELG